MITIKFENFEINSKVYDLEITKIFDIKKNDTGVLVLFNPSKEFFIKRNSKISILKDDDIIVNGQVLEVTYKETEDKMYSIITFTDDLEKINYEIVSFNLSNVYYSKILERISEILNIPIFKNEILEDTFFENYTYFGTLNEFLKEISENTNSYAYILNNYIHANIAGDSSYNVSSEDILTIKDIYSNSVIINFKKLQQWINQGSVIIFNNRKFLVEKGTHFISTIENAEFTEVECVEVT